MSLGRVIFLLWCPDQDYLLPYFVFNLESINISKSRLELEIFIHLCEISSGIITRTSGPSATSDDQNKSSGNSCDSTEPQRPPNLLISDSAPLHLPCGGGQPQLTVAFRHDSLRTLVLNTTDAPIDKLEHFLPKLPSLQELHLSLQNFLAETRCKQDDRCDPQHQLKERFKRLS